MLKRLFTDDRGLIHSADYLFLTCVVAIGGLVGVATFRDNVSQEAADVGLAVDQLDQSFTYVVPGAGYDPTVPFDPNNPVGYKVSTFADPDATNPDNPTNPLSFQQVGSIVVPGEAGTFVVGPISTDSN